MTRRGKTRTYSFPAQSPYGESLNVSFPSLQVFAKKRDIVAVHSVDERPTAILVEWFAGEDTTCVNVRALRAFAPLVGRKVSECRVLDSARGLFATKPTRTVKKDGRTVREVSRVWQCDELAIPRPPLPTQEELERSLAELDRLQIRQRCMDVPIVAFGTSAGGTMALANALARKKKRAKARRKKKARR